MCGEKMTAAEAGNQGYGGVAHTLVESAVSKTKAAGKKRGKKKKWKGLRDKGGKNQKKKKNIQK